MLSEEQLNIYQLVDRTYENRTVIQHQTLTRFVLALFPSLTAKVAKLITFYLQTVSGPIVLTHKDFSSQSYVITGDPGAQQMQNPELQYQIHTMSRDKKINLDDNETAIVLDYVHYINCQTIADSTVEEEIAFMYNSEFLCSIPRRRLYHILRKSHILNFSFNQVIYQEGQQIEPGESGSGVYIVRKGNFGYFKNREKEGKQIETLNFTKGHLFGTLEMISKIPTSQRQFTVKCKSHSGLVYRFSEDLYLNHIKPYCDNLISNRQSKLSKYIDHQVEKNDQIRQKNQPLLSQTLSRGLSTTKNFGKTAQSEEFPLLARTRLSIPNVEPINLKPLLSQKIEEEGLKKSNYFSLTKEGPLKSFPMASQRSNFIQSEFQDLNRLQRKKQISEKLKLKAMGKCTSTKGEILFSFFKQTWNFNKMKKCNSQRYA